MYLTADQEEEYFGRDDPCGEARWAFDNCRDVHRGSLEVSTTSHEDEMDGGELSQWCAIYISNDLEDLLEVSLSLDSEGVITSVDAEWYHSVSDEFKSSVELCLKRCFLEMQYTSPDDVENDINIVLNELEKQLDNSGDS